MNLKVKSSIKQQNSSLSRVYSFDVFDTCVTRCWHQPTDLFEGLFLALLAEKTLPSQQRKAAAKVLARSRIQAERTARKQTTADDITLDEIYQTLAPQLKAYNIDPTEALTKEISLEIAAVSPILSTRQYIQQLREQGHKVLFLSDMYLPGAVVRQMLIDQGFLDGLIDGFTDGREAVFVSADVGLSKGSGKLFNAVCRQLNIAPKQLHHTGDNRYADVRSARRMGVTATYFTQGEPTRYEKGFRPELIGPDWVRSQIIGNSRAVRLRHATTNQGQRQHAMLAANFLAPLLTGYVAWVLTTAQEMGIKQLYFDDGGLLVIAKTIYQHWKKQSIHHDSERAPLPTCDDWANAPTHLHTINQNNDPSDKAMPWATVGLTALRLSPPIQQQPPNQTQHPNITRHSTATSYHFRMLSAIEQTQESSSGPSDCKQHDLPYIEAPITTHGPTQGTAYLFQYRPLLQQLATTINSSALPIYRVIGLDYAETLATSILQTNSDRTLALGMLKRYAIGNIIRLLGTPTRTEVQTLIEIQKRIALPALTIGRQSTTKPMAKPILPQEVPLLIKQFIKGTDAKTTNRWLEGSLAVSAWPLQKIFYKVRSIYTVVSRDRTS